MKKMKKTFNTILSLLVAFTFVALLSNGLKQVSASEAEVVNPVAKYEFLDATNPGKDSMGNYDLVLRDADGVAAGTGVVAVENGAAKFNGTAGLQPSSNENIICYFNYIPQVYIDFYIILCIRFKLISRIK